MKKTQMEIGKEVDSWIRKEDLPIGAFLKIKKTEAIEFKSPEEREAWSDFIAWYLSLDYLPIMAIPKPDKLEFWMPHDDWKESAFNTEDFARTQVPAWKRAEGFMVAELNKRALDLAQTHASISDKEGKDRTKERFRSLLEKYPPKNGNDGLKRKRQGIAQSIWLSEAYRP